jgi:hypothetical protein
VSAISCSLTTSVLLIEGALVLNRRGIPISQLLITLRGVMICLQLPFMFASVASFRMVWLWMVTQCTGGTGVGAQTVALTVVVTRRAARDTMRSAIDRVRWRLNVQGEVTALKACRG